MEFALVAKYQSGNIAADAVRGGMRPRGTLKEEWGWVLIQRHPNPKEGLNMPLYQPM